MLQPIDFGIRIWLEEVPDEFCHLASVDMCKFIDNAIIRQPPLFCVKKKILKKRTKRIEKEKSLGGWFNFHYPIGARPYLQELG